MTEKIIERFKASNAPYGAYDCIHNATALWLEIHEMPLLPLLQYNWNIFYDRNTDVFGGNLPKEEILLFLKREYGVEVTEIDFFKLSDKKWVLVGLNSYHLSYIRDLYNIAEQNHYVLARRLGEVIEIYDYYYKYHGHLSIEQCYQYWLKFSTSISLISVSETISCIPMNMTPEIFKKNYNHLYLKVQKEILQSIDEIQNGNELISEDLKLKRYFGCIRSIALNRERHFLARADDTTYKMRILLAWGLLLREFYKISSQPQKDYSKFKKMLMEVFDIEREYLATFINFPSNN
ncbi:hypothetical protein ABE237_21480 [Brevibacillus formosus]|uniref:hypothetical protein n=1 Tax=Brevibacillus formosus TaxID=54913 RepID=UPI0018CE8E43|nr:hypothetical protein [Brevibacillus formosus]MBG9941028.1 hypothetical protein [Brevibacillus formosus]